jgi:hypothetical protein
MYELIPADTFSIDAFIVSSIILRDIPKATKSSIGDKPVDDSSLDKIIEAVIVLILIIEQEFKRASRNLGNRLSDRIGVLELPLNNRNWQRVINRRDQSLCIRIQDIERHTFGVLGLVKVNRQSAFQADDTSFSRLRASSISFSQPATNAFGFFGIFTGSGI